MRLSAAEREELAGRFRRFADHEALPLGSPLYARLCHAAADDAALLDLLAAAAPAQRRPNLLLAAVHALVLATPRQPLAAWYPSVGGDRAADAAAAVAFARLCRDRAAELRALLGARSTQTNEVGRLAALQPGVAFAQARLGGAPVILVDVGAAAGLNLLVDRVAVAYGTEVPAEAAQSAGLALTVSTRGSRPPPGRGRPSVVERIGLDERPLAVTSPADVAWLRACVWPEHTDRLARLDHAVELAREEPPRLVAGDAVTVLPDVLETLPVGHPVVLMHSAALAYLSPAQRSAFANVLEEHATRRPLAVVSMEGPTGGAADAVHAPHASSAPAGAFMLLTATTWRDGHRVDERLARADPHGRWVEWLGTEG